MLKKILLLFLTGAVIGTLLDALHVYAGIAFYAHPLLGKLAGWVPLIMGTATVFIGFSHYKLHRNGATSGQLWGSAFFFVAAYGIARIWKAEHLMVAGFMTLLYMASWFLLDRTKKGLMLAAMTAVVGSGVESFLGWLEVYNYSNPDLLGVPYWLPMLYAHGSQTAGYLGRFILSNKSNVVEMT